MVDLPMILKSAGCFSSASGGGAVFAASDATAPYDTFLPFGLWITQPFSATQSCGLTFILSAPAAISIVRAAAPARRTGTPTLRTLELPPVA
ncbi:MAG: hypothetical protein E6J89_06785 [Deltaproteobacteria bacterium]|nr:MAG: hypothetical protein E6J89_06785 [Deltaproteobacteria bacterium]